MESILLFIQKYLLAALISAIGGLANYLYKVSKGEKFSFMKIILNFFLAGWIGYIVGNVIPPQTTYYAAIISISGFSAYPILNLMETKGIDILLGVVKKLFNIQK